MKLYELVQSLQTVTPSSHIAKTVAWIALILLFVAAWYLMRILNRTLYLEIHPAVYIVLIVATVAFMAVRFRRHKRAGKTTSIYVSESFAAAGFLILAGFLIIPEGIAALNYYLPTDNEPYDVRCNVADKYTNYTRGAATYYIVFTPESSEGKDFKLKVSSSDYSIARPGKQMSLTLRKGALGYPTIVQ